MDLVIIIFIYTVKSNKSSKTVLSLTFHSTIERLILKKLARGKFGIICSNKNLIRVFKVNKRFSIKRMYKC